MAKKCHSRFCARKKSILVGLLTYAFGSFKTSAYLLCLPSFPVTDFRQKSRYSGTYSGGYRLGFSPNSLVHFPSTKCGQETTRIIFADILSLTAQFVKIKRNKNCKIAGKQIFYKLHKHYIP